MALGRSFLDQYSVFCVFGSVVGCVVVPLITQSLESLIFSAVVISITANRFSKKFVLEQGVTVAKGEQGKVKSSKELPSKKKRKPPSTPHNQTAYHQLSPSELRNRQKEENERRESEKIREQERKEEEKREKKLKKKEERLKRKCIEKKATEQKQQKTAPIEKVTEIKSPRMELRKDRSTSLYPAPSTTLLTAAQQQQRKTKYEHFRPNIPRFARMAAKQRQPPTVSPWQRSSPSPTDNNTPITPKVQSAIGSRKSEPSSPSRDTPSPSNSCSSTEEVCHVTPSKGCYTLFGESEETETLISLIRVEAGLD